MCKTTGKEDGKDLRRSLYQKLEDVVGCKWSVSVLMAVQDGVARPGALERHIDGGALAAWRRRVELPKGRVS